jgi:G3E family GTPase
MSARIPVSIVTGFLGSGKTTLLNRVLREPSMADSAVIVNELGEVALDHLLIATPRENTVVLASGCICCEVRGDLVETLADLYARRHAGELPAFARVLVETTGLADPVPLVQTVATDRQLAPLFRLDAIVATVDGVNAAAQLDAHPEAVKQAALADRLVLTKSDLVSEEACVSLERRLAALNPAALRHRAVRGEIAPQALFGAALADAAARAEDIERWLQERAVAEARERGHVHSGDIRAFCLHYEGRVTRSGLLAWLQLLAGLRGANVLRVKGLLNVEGAPVAVHVVQSVVHEPLALERWPDAERRSRIVFIARGLEPSAIEPTLPVLGLETGAGAFDPRAYARFAEAAAALRAARRA